MIVNNTFVHVNNFNTRNITNVHGTTLWEHNPEHRVGVPYANPSVSQRYRGSQNQNLARPSYEGTQRNFNTPSERFGNRQIPQNTPQPRGAFGGMGYGSAAQTHAEHGYSSLGPQRSSMPRTESRPAPEMRGPGPSGGGGRRR